jgi:myo-inositol-1(or 4)-monophosphatase
MSAEGPGPFLATAIDAVLKAGEIQLKHLGSDFQISAKEGTDIVTEVDLEVETAVRAMIAERFPTHGILAEETEEKRAPEGVAYKWLFDPIDGTVNYAHGLPIFCAALALEVNGTIEAAAVYDPSRRELFTGERGRGARLNGRPMRVSKVDRLGRAALGAGFPHGASTRIDAMEQLFCEAAVRVSAIRRLGSAALDLCNVACGRLDGFWDANLKPWDTAAGALMVQEAGGIVTSLSGGGFSCYSGQVLASNGRLHPELAGLVARCSQV